MTREPSRSRHIDGLLTVRADAAIAGLADGQEGVVSRKQLEGLGLSWGAIDGRIRRGNLHYLHRCVYAVGHRRITRRGHLIAAVLACGEGAALSHRSAAELWGIRGPWRGKPEVTTPCRSRHPRIKTYTSSLPADEITVHDGVVTTVPARTLLDLGQVLKADQLENALNQLEVLRLWDEAGIVELLGRYPRRRGTRTLRTLIAARRDGETITKRELEEKFRAFVAKYDLPRPIANGLVEGLEVDCHWPAARLIVELDSRRHHLTRRAFERDRERDRVLMLAGWRVLRVTWAQLTRESRRLARDLRALLGRRAPGD